MKFFSMNPAFPDAWGLVGNSLIIRSNVERDESTGLLHVDCVGPRMLPVTHADDDFVVSSEFRNWLCDAGLGDFSFKPVVKERVVEVPWHQWNENSDEDILIPHDADLESYFLELPHSEAAATELGDVWEWVIPAGAVMDFDVPVADAPRRFHRRIHLESWNRSEIFRAGLTSDEGDDGPVFVTENAKQILSGRWPQYLRFSECLVL